MQDPSGLGRARRRSSPSSPVGRSRSRSRGRSRKPQAVFPTTFRGRATFGLWVSPAAAEQAVTATARSTSKDERPRGAAFAAEVGTFPSPPGRLHPHEWQIYRRLDRPRTAGIAKLEISGSFASARLTDHDHDRREEAQRDRRRPPLQDAAGLPEPGQSLRPRPSGFPHLGEQALDLALGRPAPAPSRSPAARTQHPRPIQGQSCETAERSPANNRIAPSTGVRRRDRSAQFVPGWKYRRNLRLASGSGGDRPGPHRCPVTPTAPKPTTALSTCSDYQ